MAPNLDSNDCSSLLEAAKVCRMARNSLSPVLVKLSGMFITFEEIITNNKWNIKPEIQSWENVFIRGLVKFVPAVAYHFCLNLPE